LGLALFLCACNEYKYLAVPVTYNPKYLFKPDTNVILLISQIQLNTYKITGRKLGAIKAGAYTALKYAGNSFGKLPHVKVINLVDSVSLAANTDSIRLLSLKYHSDYILALTDFSADIGLTEVENSTAYYNSDVSAKFILFQGNGIYSKKLEGTSNEPQSQGVYLGFVASLFIHPTVGGNKQSINTAAEHAAQNAVQDYLPSTISHNRPLYNDSYLQPMVKEILANRFDKAYNLCQPYLQDKNVVWSSRAAYNLAVVYEAQGDIDLAINFAQLSLDKNKNQYASALLSDLKPN
jgi:hypothetical protein